MQELAGLTGKSPSSVSRYAHELVRVGVLERDSYKGGLRFGPRAMDYLTAWGLAEYYV